MVKDASGRSLGTRGGGEARGQGLGRTVGVDVTGNSAESPSILRLTLALYFALSEDGGCETNQALRSFLSSIRCIQESIDALHRSMSVRRRPFVRPTVPRPVSPGTWAELIFPVYRRVPEEP